MRHRPDLNRAYWLGFAFLFLAVAIPAYAGPNVLDDVGQTYKDASGGWGDVLVPIAKSLFMKLALIELLWSGIWWVIERDDPNQVLVALLRKIMPLMFFWAILLNFDSWIPAVIDSFSLAGQKAGKLPALTPSSVLDRGLEVATTVTNAASAIGLFSGNASKFILAGLAALGILLCFGVIAGQMLVTLIESYIVVSGGVLFLGFAGSRWTTTFSEKYISYAVGVGVKLFVTYLIIGAGQHVSDTWAAKITTDMVVSDYLSILVGALVYMFLAWQIPSLASSMLSGTVSMTLGAAAATAGTMAAGAAGAAGLAQAGLASGANSVAGAVQAGNAAISHGQAGGGNIAQVTGSALGALATAGAQAVGETIRGFGSGTSGSSLAQRIGGNTASMLEARAAGAPAASVPGGQPSAPSAPSAPVSAPAPAPAAAGAAGGASAASAAQTPERATPPAPASAGGTGGAPAPAGAGASSQPSAPASSIIDTSGNISQALADRNSGAPPAPPAQTSAPSTEAATSAAAPADGTAAAAPAGGTTGAAPAAPSQPAAPAAPGAQQNDQPRKEDKPNALQQLSEHAQALGNMPNDSAAGAGVQINLKHD